MEQFVKANIKGLIINKKPQRNKLYFLFNLILNRKNFNYNWPDRALYRASKLLLCCRKRCLTKHCSKRYQVAEKNHELYEKGKKKLTKDLDIVKLI